MDVICNHCGKEFHVKPSVYKKNKTKVFYCCKECMLSHKHVDKVIVKCAYCGKEIERRVTEVAVNNFCNRECAKKFTPTITLNCEQCGKEFTLKESYYKKQSKRGQTPKYCSNECKFDAIDKIKNGTVEEVKCDYCGNMFLKSKRKLTENGLSFCDINCKKNYFKEFHRVDVICKNCGKIFSKNKYRYDSAKNHFCCQKCFDEYRTALKTTYQEIAHYLRSSHEYEEWRKKCMERDFYKCSKCDSKEQLHVHHIEQLFYICDKYNMNLDEIKKSKEFNDINNGITLCSNCHALEHPFVPRDEKGRFCRPHSKSLKSEDN